MRRTKLAGAYQLHIRKPTYFYFKTSPFLANMISHLLLQILRRNKN